MSTPNQFEIHERLATLEAGQLYTNATLKEVKDMLKDHTTQSCAGNCDVGQQVTTIQSSLKTYKRITWFSLAAIVTAGFKSMFPL